MKSHTKNYLPITALIVGILSIFIIRSLLAANQSVPRLFDLFDTLTIVGSLIVLVIGHQSLRTSDWILASAMGILIGFGMQFATLYSPYPFFGVINNQSGQAVIRGIFTTLAVLGGTTLMRQGGPVRFHLANGAWRKTAINRLIGLMIGLPLAVLNVFALQFTQEQSISWQNPFAALLDALQPGIVEEVIYRFALVGIFWLILRTSLPTQAGWVSGLLAMLIHNFAHLDDLFVQSPLTAVGIGLITALVWGIPMTLLALRRGLESAIVFHWIQDAARFFAGF